MTRVGPFSAPFRVPFPCRFPILLYNEIEFRFVHDLQELITTLKRKGVDVPENIADAAGLTEYAVQARYPRGDASVTEQEDREAVDTAQRVVSWAEKIIQP